MGFEIEILYVLIFGVYTGCLSGIRLWAHMLDMLSELFYRFLSVESLLISPVMTNATTFLNMLCVYTTHTLAVMVSITHGN